MVVVECSNSPGCLCFPVLGATDPINSDQTPFSSLVTMLSPSMCFTVNIQGAWARWSWLSISPVRISQTGLQSWVVLTIYTAKVDLENCLCDYILISDPNGKLTFAGFLATSVLISETCAAYIAVSPQPWVLKIKRRN